MARGRVLGPDTINENVRKTNYAVRGELYLRASELQKEGKKRVSLYGPVKADKELFFHIDEGVFVSVDVKNSSVSTIRGDWECFYRQPHLSDLEIVFTNVGNPHALGQKPLTFPRQVMALCQAPFLLDDPKVGQLFPPDAIARAKHYLSLTSGGVGAYSDSRGLPGVRQEIAEFLLERDGHPSNPEHIFLTDGASKGVQQVLNAVIRNSNDGVLVPIPQYPLYSASIQLLGGSLVPYYLNESSNWGLDVPDLKANVSAARKKGLSVRSLVFINPGNPTGQCLTAQNLKELIEFCYAEKLVLLADEVYQTNVYQDERPFISARKVLLDMGGPISEELELVSFHTVSKGYFGECGQRGGYLEMTNIHPAVVDELYKVASIALSPNITGQILMGLMVKPPRPGDYSYPLYAAESKGILESLRKRAHLMTDGFNACTNVECNFTEGAMYSFPLIKLPPRAVEAAKKAQKTPDVFYCLKLLEVTGISTVPGSGFGQKEGTFHMRTTILPSLEEMPAVMDSFKKFNDAFMADYSVQKSRL